MPSADFPMQLHRATFRTAAVSFWGLASIVMAANFIGNDLRVNYTVEWIVTGLAYAGGVVCWLLPWGQIPARRFIPVVFGGIGMGTGGLFATGGGRGPPPVPFPFFLLFSAAVFQVSVSPPG